MSRIDSSPGRVVDSSQSFQEVEASHMLSISSQGKCALESESDSCVSKYNSTMACYSTAIKGCVQMLFSFMYAQNNLLNSSDSFEELASLQLLTGLIHNPKPLFRLAETKCNLLFLSCKLTYSQTLPLMTSYNKHNFTHRP